MVYQGRADYLATTGNHWMQWALGMAFHKRHSKVGIWDILLDYYVGSLVVASSRGAHVFSYGRGVRSYHHTVLSRRMGIPLVFPGKSAASYKDCGRIGLREDPRDPIRNVKRPTKHTASCQVLVFKHTNTTNTTTSCQIPVFKYANSDRQQYHQQHTHHDPLCSARMGYRPTISDI